MKCFMLLQYTELTASYSFTQRDLIKEPTKNFASVIDAHFKSDFKPSTYNGFAEEPTDANLCTNNSVQKREFTGPNGSVTKMTLKNNHLIVETEERNDISRHARETKMHYNSSLGKDGVFVVEVARGVDSQNIPEYPLVEHQEPIYQTIAAKPIVLTVNAEKSPTHQEEVQVHQPPREIAKVEDLEPAKLQQIIEVEEEQAQSVENNLIRHSNTGLSQSDLSSTSSTDSNKGYNYGNQTLYTLEQPYNGQSPAKIDTSQTPTEGVKLQTDDDQSKPENGESAMQSPIIQSSNAEDSSADTQEEIDAKPIKNERNEPVMSEEKAPELLQAEFEAKTAVTEAIELATKAVEVAVSKQDLADLQPAVIELQVEDDVVKKPPLVNGHNCDSKPDELSISKEAPIVSYGLNGVETDVENAYDSLMSLPEPPSSEEITQLSDCNNADVNQLDSLPPPPPPLFMADTNGTHHEAETATKAVENGHHNGKADLSVCPEVIPPPAPMISALKDVMKSNNDKNLLSTPLTPPESPPTLHCGNGSLCAPLSVVAVNVNGS